MKTGRKLLALLLSLILLLGSIPAFAQPLDPDIKDLYIATTEPLETVIDALINSPPADPTIEEKIEEWAKQIASTALEKLLEKLFPNIAVKMEQYSPEAELKNMLANIKTQLDDIQMDLGSIKDQITCTELNSIFNEFALASSYTAPFTALKTLQDIDNDPNMSSEQKAKERLSSLTEGLGITNGSVDTKLDNYTDLMVRMITMTYNVNLDGREVRLDLLDLLYELMKRTYKWENDAYEYWNTFQNNILSFVTALVTVNRMSVAARYALWPSKILQERMEVLEGFVTDLQGLRTREVLQLKPEYRHYWWRGERDYYFYTQLNTRDIPQEDKKAGVQAGYLKSLRGLTYKNEGGTYFFSPKESFWEPFVSYSYDHSNLITLDALQKIYSDYEGKKSLWDIFFTETEGNFNKPSGDYSSWCWIIHPDSRYALTYHSHLFKGDEVYCYYARDPGVTNKGSTALKTDKLDLCIYHNTHSDPKTCLNSIGIGMYVRKNMNRPEIITDAIIDPVPPETGDSTPVTLYILLSAAAVGAAIAILKGKKHK